MGGDTPLPLPLSVRSMTGQLTDGTGQSMPLSCLTNLNIIWAWSYDPRTHVVNDLIIS